MIDFTKNTPDSVDPTYQLDNKKEVIGLYLSFGNDQQLEVIDLISELYDGTKTTRKELVSGQWVRAEAICREHDFISYKNGDSEGEFFPVLTQRGNILVSVSQ